LSQPDKQELLFSLGACLALATAVSITAPVAVADCVTIQSGALENLAGETIEPGYDTWGYNYQANMFNGGYCDASRGAQSCLDEGFADVELIMKWNNAWLSNEDCDGDNLLDRHLGHQSYVGSGAWLTNHQSGTYANPDNPNRTCRWTYFVKIVAAPADATLANGVWSDGSGDEIGPAIWGDFAVVQEVINDPCAGQNGLAYKGIRPALGNWETDPNP
jgi:hypothetical protein